jgi:hypothetical protein
LEVQAMTDIVERLRKRIEVAERESRFGDAEDFREAADEIERLRALLDRPRDDGTVVAVGGEPGASAGKSE